MKTNTGYKPIATTEQLEVTGFKGPRRVERLFRGINTRQGAHKVLQKIYKNLPKEERRRLDYYRYEMSIRTATSNFLIENNRLPSVLEIEYETGISRTTIYKHLNADHQGFEKEFELKIKKLRKQAIERLYVIGVNNGNVKAITEFLKLTGNQAAVKPENSLIQINNIYIDQRTIHSLSDDTKEKLEILLLESAKVDKS